jgi:glycosyltransferase involved in cell wall biosynthesis
MHLSVIIPCFNYAAFVGAAIDSVRRSTRQPDEVIVVDDGSTDDSAEIIARYDHVRLLRKPNGGMASALNLGIAAATGDVVVFLDADDEMSPERLEWIADAFENPEVCLAWHPLEITDPTGNVRGLLPPGPLTSGDISGSTAAEGLQHFAVTSGIAVRRRSLEELGPIPEDQFRNTAEAFLVRTLPFMGTVAATSVPLGTYRVHAGSEMRALADLELPTMIAKLDRRLGQIAAEHALLVRSARAAGYECDDAELRANDRPFLEIAAAHARLRSDGRRAGRAAMRALAAGCHWPSSRRAAWFRAKSLLYTVAPKHSLVLLFAVRLGEVSHPSWLRWAAKAYWRMVGARHAVVRWATRARQLGRRVAA